MPFEMASTPVIAVQPFANAWSRRNAPRVSVPIAAGGVDAGGDGKWPLTARQTPMLIKIPTLMMKAYVGAANMRPDCRMPLRFPHAIRPMNAIAVRTRKPSRDGAADTIAETPADTLTAT